MAVFHRKYLLIGFVLVCAAVAQAGRAAQPELANGVFLVAKPELLDPNFRETVVLVTQPQVGGGPLGVVLNRPLGARLSEVFPGVTKVPALVDEIYAGGPVQRGRILYLLRSAERPERSLHVLGDVYMSADIELLGKIVSGEAQFPAFRAYAGYSAWAPRQLQAEIAAGGWYVIPADTDVIFTSDPAEMWSELIKRIATRSTEFSAPREALAVSR